MSTGRLILIVLIAAALAGSGAAAFNASPQLSEWFGEAPPSAASPTPNPEPVAEAPKPYDPLGELEPGVIARLADPKQDAPSDFKRLPFVKPADFCRSLGALGLANAAFQGGAFPTPSWTCVTDLWKPAGMEVTVASSLFVTARGDDPDRLGTLRIKLNLIDPKTVPTAKSTAKEMLTRIYSGLGWELPQAVVDAIEASKDAKIDDHGVVFDYRREYGPAERYNLIVAFPQRLGVGGEDSFYTTRRRPTSLPPGTLPPQPDGSPEQPGMTDGFSQQPAGQPPADPGAQQMGLPQQGPPSQIQ